MATYRASIRVSDTDTSPLVLEIEAADDRAALDRAIKCTLNPSHVVGLVRLDWVDVLGGAKGAAIAQFYPFMAEIKSDDGNVRVVRFSQTSPSAAYERAFAACQPNETVIRLAKQEGTAWKTIRFADM